MNANLIQAATSIQLRQFEDSIYQESVDNRPENTTRTYTQYQTEFMNWCREHALLRLNPIPHLVSADTLLLYLQSQDGRLSRRAGDQEREVGSKTYSGMVSAIIDLWKSQVIYFSDFHTLVCSILLGCSTYKHTS